MHLPVLHRSPMQRRRPRTGNEGILESVVHSCQVGPSARSRREAKGFPVPAAQPRHITLSRARSRLDQRRFLQPRPHFAAFFEIYKKIIFSRANFTKFFKILTKFSQNFGKIFKILKIFQNFSKFYKIAKFLPNFCRNLQNLFTRR